MQNTIQQNGNVNLSSVSSSSASTELKTGDSHQKDIDNLINDLTSLAALVNKALQMIRESIQEWRDALSNSQAKGMMLMLNQAVENNATQKQANQKECDAAYKASWGDFAKGCASILGGGLTLGGAAFGSTATQTKLGGVSTALDGGASIAKGFLTQEAADITREAKDKTADVQLQNKVLETWEKQLSQGGQRLNEMQSQLSSINEQLRQSTGQLNYSLAQQ
ncbi:hypothetical protein M9194_20450 [Vibrio sp. S4M6]|uniref:hypothetical protein n=1 Tax=Vibrio sinus TaxID=2946865 RepID=UPI002029F871|nr:hypothetical protein [Vibrio sinus]MCL9783800.1 hypothetical protein [Vibrio sinus]